MMSQSFWLPLAGGRPDAPAVGLHRPVDAVEPVAGVVAVPVAGLGAQDLVAGHEERHALRQRHDREAEPMHAHAIGARHRRAQLEIHRVEPVRIVVHADVLDRVVGIARRKRRACRSSRRRCRGMRVAEAIDDRVARDVAGEAEAHEVGEPQQFGLRVGRRAAERAVRLGEQAGGEALVAARARTARRRAPRRGCGPRTSRCPCPPCSPGSRSRRGRCWP